MKNILPLIAFLLFACAGFSQGTIKGKITDSSGKQVLGLATVTVFKAADTVLITYRLSNHEGEFKVPGLPLNVLCRFLISYLGYKVHRQEFTLTADKSEIDFGKILMATDAKNLDDVLVVAERPPVSFRQDTIEFNAAAFKTLPTALTEDLLKKLPGVQIDADGNITVNGKKVNRILVDGKEFFGNDPKMATRNLPAQMIDKVQVSEDKDEAELNPDKSKGDIGQVINLKLKKGVKKGWFGKAYAGAGTDDLYEAGTILNLFKDTMQVSLLGFSNNLNRAGFGFNDIQSLGGFGRSGTNMIMMNGTGGLNINGISFGGLGEGINRSTGAGINMNHVLKNGLTLNSQYFYGRSRNDILEKNNRQQFLGDTTFVTRSTRQEVVVSNSHRIAFGLKGKIDSLSRFEFKPNLAITDQESNKHTDFLNSNNFKGQLTGSNNKQLLDGSDVTYNHSLLLFKNFRKKGRTLNLNNSLNYGKGSIDQVNNVLNTFYETGGTSSLDQLRDRETNNFNTTFNANYNDPLNKQFSLRLNYALTYFDNADDLATFIRDANGKYEIPNLSLSNALSRKSLRNSFSAGVNWKYKKFNITTSAMLQTLDIYNNFKNAQAKVDQHFQFFLPQLNINWKEMTFSYSVNVSPPNIQDVQPVPDNSNPLYITYGNVNLKPVKSHNFYLNFFKNITEKMLSVNAYLNGNITENAIARVRSIDANGVQVSRPENVDGNRNFYTNFNINKQYKLNKKFQFSIGGGYNANYTKTFLSINGRQGFGNSYSFRPAGRVSLNWRDIIEYSIDHGRTFATTNYQNNIFNDINITTHRTNTELVVRWPKNVVWESSLAYNYNSNVAPGLQRTSALLNGGVTYLFLKDQKGQLKLSVFDLLNDNIDLWRFTSENSIIDRQINILERYLLLTFTYNIRNFKAGKVGGRERFFMF
ncbi:MAG TPA: outer membrane beta-barrel protein [Segetibacter sp.]|jgi:hypothetical protein